MDAYNITSREKRKEILYPPDHANSDGSNAKDEKFF